MPSSSDAYMELSDPAVWGETFDEQFGMGPKGRKLGAFELSSFTFAVSADDVEKKDHTKAGHAASGKVAAAIKQPAKKKFSIKKFVDKASPDLFLACCKKDKIAWCIISVRETGEVNRKPYLVIEFRNLHVVAFNWELTPGDPESAAQMESIDFDYQTVLIKYSRQDVSGEHRVVKMKGWDFGDHPQDVEELDQELQAEQQED